MSCRHCPQRLARLPAVVVCVFAAHGALSAATASVDLGTSDTESGVANSYNADGTDGENAACAVGGREGRRPLGGNDETAPADDPPDRFLYFTVSSSAVNGSSAFVITATLFDDAGARDHVVLLEYVSARATSSDDLRRVFALHPHHPRLRGTNGWVDLTWVVRGANFSDHLQRSVADFRLSSRSAQRHFSHLCYDKVTVSNETPDVLDCPDGLVASVDPQDGTVELSWSSPTEYDRILVFRNGRSLDVLPGDVGMFEDAPLPGRYLYELIPLKDGEACVSPSLRTEVRVFPEVTRCGCPNPDVNRDGVVDLQDVSVVTSNLDLSPESPRFNIEADATHDGVIDLEDVELVLLYAHLEGPAPTLELELEPLDAVGSLSEPGPMIRIESPQAAGSGDLDENPQSLLRHGRLLVVSGSGDTERLVELEPRTGAERAFSDTNRTDAAADRAVAGVTALSFVGPTVNVANRSAPIGASEYPVGSFARLDPSSGDPLEGGSLGAAPATGIFVEDQDAIDARVGPDTNQRPGGGFLNELAGLAEGGPGPDGDEVWPRNRVVFQTGWEYDTLERRAVISAADLDTGLYEVAAIGDDLGLPGPIVFLPRAGAPESLAFPDAVMIAAVDGNIVNDQPAPPGEGFVLDGGVLDATRARPEDRVEFAVNLSNLPAAGDYAVRVVARLAPGALAGQVELEATHSASAVGRRLYRGSFPGKLGGSRRSVPLGRLTLSRDRAQETLVLRVSEPGVLVESIELEGPLGGQLFVAMRDPGSVVVFGLTLATLPGGEIGYRGIPERIFGVCPVELDGRGRVVVDPVAMDVVDLDGEEKLFLLDSLRNQVSVFSLSGEFERCTHVPLQGSFLTGMARAADGPGDDLPSLYLGARSRSGGGGGDSPAADGAAAGVGQGSSTSGVSRVLDIDAIFFDRVASDIVRPLAIGDRRSLVLKARFADGSTRDVTRHAAFTNLDPDVVELEQAGRIRARRSAGVADIRGTLQGLLAETRVLVSAAGKPFRSRRPVPFVAVPPLGSDETVVVFPNPDAMSSAFGTSFDLLRFPVGYRQWFSAVVFDASGRAAAPGDVSWSVDSPAGNTIDHNGVLSANQPENPAAVGVGSAESTGLATTATLRGPAAGLQAAEVVSDPLPIAVFDPVSVAAGPPAAIRIFPRDLRVIPGSSLRFVAVLLDTNGLPVNIASPPGDEAPNLPGARWSSDGAPIDSRTGMFHASYSGETVDEVTTITVVEPLTGLSDSVSVTVLYSQVNGLESLAEAQKLRLLGSLLTSDLKELFLDAAASRLEETEIELTAVNASGLASQLVEADLAPIVGDLEALFFRIDSEFEMDLLLELQFELDDHPEFAIAPSDPGSEKDALETRLRLEVTEVLNAALRDFELQLSVDLINFLEERCEEFATMLVCKEEFCDLIRDINHAAEERPVTVQDLEDELIGSFIDYIARLRFATGRFGAFDEARWWTKSGIPMDRFLAERFITASGISERLDALKRAILLILFGRDFDACLLNMRDALIKPVSLGICHLLALTLGLLGVEVNVSNCTSTLSEWLESGLRSLVDNLFDGLQTGLADLLEVIFRERFVKPAEAFLFNEYLEPILGEVEGGFDALVSLDDLGRGGMIRFDGVAVQDPAVAFEKPPLGNFAGTALVAGEEMPGFVQAMLFSYEGFPRHVALAGFGRDGSPSASPLDSENGPAGGNVGVASRIDDVFSNLLRYGGSSVYRSGDGALRGAVAVADSTVTTADGDVELAAATIGSPRFVLEDSSPGALAGRVEQLVAVVASGALEYTVSAVLTAPLVFSQDGQRIEVDIASGSPSRIDAPAAGEMPLAQQIRELVTNAFPNPRAFITGTLGARLPISVEYPARAGEQQTPEPEIGHFEVELDRADTDDAFEDDLLSVNFAPLRAGAPIRQSQPRYRRGDCNDDGSIDISDPIAALRFLFLGDEPPRCRTSCDTNGDGRVSVSDAVYQLQWLAAGGPAPPEPFSACGTVERKAECPEGSHGCS